MCLLSLYCINRQRELAMIKYEITLTEGRDMCNENKGIC